jgi:hypothetical protein
MSAASPSLQPLLHDGLVALSAPTQVWSRSSGDVGAAPIDGLYNGDTRFIRALELSVDGEFPEWVSRVETRPSLHHFGGLLRRLDDPDPDPKVRILRTRDVAAGQIVETITVRSHLPADITTTVRVRISLDDASLNEVKSGKPRSALADVRLQSDGGAGASAVFSEGRSLEIRADGAAVSFDTIDVILDWVVRVPARAAAMIEFTITIDDPTLVVSAPHRRGEWPAALPTGDRRVARWYSRAVGDLDALRLTLPANPHDEFFAAGAPWFLTLFGRDSIWAARLSLPVDLETAASTLRILAGLQGEKEDAGTAEQPGKILHELRSARVEIPGEGLILPPIYYGTVDATPLWVCLLADAWDAGLPETDLRTLLPALRGCLSWITDHGDSDGDGFLDYLDLTGHALANQGWKDSGDSIQWRDGTIAEGPIALCEVQGYAYEAAIAGARMLVGLGEPGAESLQEWAAQLKARFAEQFWVDTAEGRYPAIALDGSKRAVDSLTSNIGHLLGTGILTPAEEVAVADLLVGPSMRSGYGIRTLSTGASGYWPLSYHGGSVWAHDTAIILNGMHRAGLVDHAALVADDLLAAAEGFDYRVPELHSGDAASASSVPTPYPAACRPQAWSAAAAIVVARTAGAIPAALQGGR